VRVVSFVAGFHLVTAALARALEEEARRRGCRSLYVEVGHEQPKARSFWSKQGFAPANSSDASAVSDEQALFYEHACLPLQTRRSG